MKILVCHNHYSAHGGEDEVFNDECTVLRDHGHEVTRYQRSNQELDQTGQLRNAVRTVWNHSVYRELRELIERVQPHVVHFHNTFPLMSPAAIVAAKHAGTATVQTLHNYRLLCPTSSLMRDDSPCEKCVGKRFAWNALRHRCYRGSLGASAATVGMLAAHWGLGTWQRSVDRYIALTDFSKQKFVAGGLPEDRITIKPNFVRHDPGLGVGDGNYAIFVGRVTTLKGIPVLLRAWRESNIDLPLRIVGDGHLLPELKRQLSDPRIQLLGHRDHDDVMQQIRGARLLIFPSSSYETFGRSMIEAFAAGTPVVASNIGANPEMLQHGRCGLLFERDNHVDLMRNVQSLLNDSTLYARLRRAGRSRFEACYSADNNYRQLLRIYREVSNTAPVPVAAAPHVKLSRSARSAEQ